MKKIITIITLFNAIALWGMESNQTDKNGFAQNEQKPKNTKNQDLEQDAQQDHNYDPEAGQYDSHNENNQPSNSSLLSGVAKTAVIIATTRVPVSVKSDSSSTTVVSKNLAGESTAETIGSDGNNLYSKREDNNLFSTEKKATSIGSDGIENSKSAQYGTIGGYEGSSTINKDGVQASERWNCCGRQCGYSYSCNPCKAASACCATSAQCASGLMKMMGSCCSASMNCIRCVGSGLDQVASCLSCPFLVLFAILEALGDIAPRR